MTRSQMYDMGPYVNITPRHLHLHRTSNENDENHDNLTQGVPRTSITFPAISIAQSLPKYLHSRALSGARSGKSRFQSVLTIKPHNWPLPIQSDQQKPNLYPNPHHPIAGQNIEDYPISILGTNASYFSGRSKPPIYSFTTRICGAHRINSVIDSPPQSHHQSRAISGGHTATAPIEEGDPLT